MRCCRVGRSSRAPATKCHVSLLQTAAAVRKEFPTLPILVGGQAFRWGGRERTEEIEGVRHLGSLADLESWIKSPPHHAN